MANIRKTFNFRNGVQVDEDNFIVDSLGKVGIGTTVPTQMIDCRGDAKVVGIITSQSIETRNVNVAGVTTFSGDTHVGAAITFYPSAGIISATQFHGDGTRLINIPTSQWTDIIEKAGGVNVFKDLPGHTTHVDMEAILSENPDVLMFDGITFDIGFNSFDEDKMCETHMNFIRDRDGFDNMDAVNNNRMIIMSGEFAGPMMIHGLPTLAKILHPELFEDLDTDLFIEDYFEKYHNIEKNGKFVCYSFLFSFLILFMLRQPIIVG